MKRRALPLGVVFLSLALAGCLGSSVERRTIDVSAFRSWAGQTTQAQPDTLIPGRVDVGQRIPEIGDGSAVGIEEVSLFVQLQNLDASPAEVTVYAMPRAVSDREVVLAEGLPITRGIAIDGQSAVQLDARNYPFQSRNFEEFVDLVSAGDFYLYVVATGDVFNVSANVPSLSFLVTVD